MTTNSRFIQSSRMKLYELHVFNSSFCTIDHCHTVTRCDRWVRSSSVHLPISTGRHQCDLGKNFFYLICYMIQHIYTITFHIGSGFRNQETKMMLRDYINDKTMLDHFDILLFTYCIQQGSFHFPTRNILMMQDPE